MKDEIDLEIVQQMIAEECDGVKNLLLRKNEEYGNSAIQPKRIFSQSSPVEQIKVRIDDKLSRIQNLGVVGAGPDASEDTIKDLLGYLILLRIAQRLSV